MDYLIVKKVGEDEKRYLDKYGEFGPKSRAYAMPWWIARVVLRSCFSDSDRFDVEEVKW